MRMVLCCCDYGFLNKVDPWFHFLVLVQKKPNINNILISLCRTGCVWSAWVLLWPFSVLWDLVGNTEARVLPGSKMLSTAELKNSFHAIRGLFQFQTIGMNSTRFPLKHANGLLRSQAWWLGHFHSHGKSSYITWICLQFETKHHFTAPDAANALQDPFQSLCPFQF